MTVSRRSFSVALVAPAVSVSQPETFEWFEQSKDGLIACCSRGAGAIRAEMKVFVHRDEGYEVCLKTLDHARLSVTRYLNKVKEA